MSQTVSFTESDLSYLAERGISASEAERQLQLLIDGTPYLVIVDSAKLERGIMRLTTSEMVQYLDLWHDYLQRQGTDVVKFVPASGAASRMFKDLYALPKEQQIAHDDLTPEQQTFVDHLESFAFYEKLSETCLRNNWRTMNKLVESEQYGTIIDNLLDTHGMGYGSLPKGMLLFHDYPNGTKRTPIEEHMVEGALYAQDIHGRVRLHFTVSPEHLGGFRSLVDRRIQTYEDLLGCHYEVNYSVQEPSTDTIALDVEQGLPFRRTDGTLLLRPGGHGTLIGNLGRLDASVVFIKNIDNVTPDHLKSNTVLYKKLLGGILLAVRDRIFGYIQQLKRSKVSKTLMEEILTFLDETLCIQIPHADLLSEEELIPKLLAKLNRPIRVCGMVRNEGEPGGGPYLVREPDGTTSLQILESVQVDKNNPEALEMMRQGTHFNPVDLCCYIRDYEGNPFDLHNYVNPQTAFISDKSVEGRPLRALEHPGLWNGAMHDWNTIFVEVPSDTFTPVKTVLDLLRPEHQPLAD